MQVRKKARLTSIQLTLLLLTTPAETGVWLTGSFLPFRTERGLGPLAFFLLCFFVSTLGDASALRASITDCSYSVGFTLAVPSFMEEDGRWWVHGVYRHVL